MGCCQIEETLGDVKNSSDCYHGFCILNCFQIASNDIEAIEETGGLLRHVSTPVDDLHDWIDRVSMSTISSEAVEDKIKALQVRHAHVFYMVIYPSMSCTDHLLASFPGLPRFLFFGLHSV